jgi:hypothetical protein
MEVPRSDEATRGAPRDHDDERPELRAPAKAPQRAHVVLRERRERADERLVGELRIISRAAALEDRPHGGIDDAAVALDEPLERARLAGEAGADQLRIALAIDVPGLRRHLREDRRSARSRQ